MWLDFKKKVEMVEMIPLFEISVFSYNKTSLIHWNLMIILWISICQQAILLSWASLPLLIVSVCSLWSNFWHHCCDAKKSSHCSRSNLTRYYSLFFLQRGGPDKWCITIKFRTSQIWTWEEFIFESTDITLKTRFCEYLFIFFFLYDVQTQYC